MGHKKYSILTDISPECPVITKAFLNNLNLALLLALKDAGHITEPQLRRALNILEQS